MGFSGNRGARRPAQGGRVEDTMPGSAAVFVTLAFAFLGKRSPHVNDRATMARLRDAAKRLPHQGDREIARRKRQLDRLAGRK
jgi:hypothetical protein